MSDVTYSVIQKRATWHVTRDAVWRAIEAANRSAAWRGTLCATDDATRVVWPLTWVTKQAVSRCTDEVGR